METLCFIVQIWPHFILLMDPLQPTAVSTNKRKDSSDRMRNTYSVSAPIPPNPWTLLGGAVFLYANDGLVARGSRRASEWELVARGTNH